MAIQLNFIDSFTFTDPNDLSPTVTPESGLQGDGIAFNPVSRTLFVARTDAPNGPPPDKSVLEFQALDNTVPLGGNFGEFIDEFAVDGATTGFVTAVGLTALPNGNLLIADAVSGSILEIDPNNGAIIPGGINITPPDDFLDRDARGLIVGAAYSELTDTVVVITSRSQEIVEFDRNGNILSAIDASQYGLTLAAGIAIDTSTGNFLVTEDFRGSNKIYEIAPARPELLPPSLESSNPPQSGELVSIIDVAAQTGINDPEGITIDAATGTVYVIFDGDDVDSEGNPIVNNQVAAFSIASASATELTLESQFDFLDGEGIAFNSARGTLFAAQSSGNGTPDDPSTWQVIEFSADGSGTQINAFTIGDFNQELFGFLGFNGNLVLTGISALPNGNLLLTDGLSGRITEVDPETEALAVDGIDFTNNDFGLLFSGFSASISGLVYNANTETIFATEFFGSTILEFDPSDGAVIRSYDLGGLTPIPLFPQGITYDPVSGNYFVAGDSDSNNTIYEFTLSVDGEDNGVVSFVGSTNVGVETGIVDPEGLTIDPATRTLYASYDNDAFILAGDGTDGTIAFPISGGSQIASFSLSNDPSNPTIIAPQPEETVRGTIGEDSFVVSLLPEAAFDGSNDTVFTFSGNDVVDATGGFGGNRISTGSGDDIIYVSSNDKAFGGSGDDTFFTTGGSGNTLSGGIGDDEFYLSSGDRVLGGAGNDTFFGASGSNNSVSGGAGDDTFFLGSGDRAFGGSGADTFWITSSGDLPPEANIVGGFELGVDFIGVTDFTFDDLEFDGNAISINGVEIANVVGVNTASLSQSDFVFA